MKTQDWDWENHKARLIIMYSYKPVYSGFIFTKQRITLRIWFQQQFLWAKSIRQLLSEKLLSLKKWSLKTLWYGDAEACPENHGLGSLDNPGGKGPQEISRAPLCSKQGHLWDRKGLLRALSWNPPRTAPAQPPCPTADDLHGGKSIFWQSSGTSFVLSYVCSLLAVKSLDLSSHWPPCRYCWTAIRPSKLQRCHHSMFTHWWAVTLRESV